MWTIASVTVGGEDVSEDGGISAFVLDLAGQNRRPDPAIQ